ncbi:MAG: P22 coat protein - protein 5 domain protein [Dehalococcoidia bacterium]|nr:P22 coat protein - protein 5 domain protein [Dehalococcoidia bacterium]
MSLNNFIPKIWSGKILENLNNAHEAAKCCNKDYEGEIKSLGDTLTILSHGHVTIKAYTKGSLLAAPDRLQDAAMSLVIDTAKYFNVTVDDVDKVQMKPTIMSSAMRDAAWGMADISDLAIILALYNGVTTTAPDNLLASRALGTGATDEDAYETLVDLGVKLDESNAPSADRFALISPWVYGLLKKDPRFTSFGTEQNTRRLRGEPLGEVENLTIYKSNNIYPALSSAYAIIAGSKVACTFAEQIDKVEAFRPPDDFSDAVKGLYLFGLKVVRPTCLAVCPVTVA